MSIWKIIILAVIQGLAELLPVSSSAHVVVAEKLMGLDPTSPAMTLLLVMLHTGTMFAVIVYFWQAWKRSFFSSSAVFKLQALRLIVATVLTAAVGGPLMLAVPRLAAKLGLLAKDMNGQLPKAEIENLFGNLELIAVALAAVGLLILWAGLSKRSTGTREVALREASWMGALQGLCLPFRGFSRSGATISTGLLLGGIKPRVEEFSFALAVIITPPVIGREVLRLLKHNTESAIPVHLASLFLPSLLGLLFSFVAGLIALKFLSRVLERGRWHLFGFYCLAAAMIVFALYLKGF